MADTRMKFCLNMVHDRPYAETMKWWKAAEDAGIYSIGMPDSPVRLRELYVSSGYLLLNTSHINVLTCVTNPVTRHPAVTASGLMAINELAPGRVSLGIGTGDGALWSIGMKKAASVAHLREYILAVKGLLKGEEVEYRGRRFKSGWHGAEGQDKVRIYVACSGSKVLRMASQIADGMIIQMGYGPENLSHIKSVIGEGCAEVGRNPDDLDLWWTTELIFGDTPEDSKRVNLGVNVGWLVLSSMDGKQIPEEYKEPLFRLINEMPDHTVSYEDPAWGEYMVSQARKLGIYDWIVSRAPGLWGTPKDVSSRLAELGDQGLTNWMFYVGRRNVDRMDLIEKLRTGVLPNLA